MKKVDVRDPERVGQFASGYWTAKRYEREHPDEAVIATDLILEDGKVVGLELTVVPR